MIITITTNFCLICRLLLLFLLLLLVFVFVLLAETHERHQQWEMYQCVSEQLPGAGAVCLLVKPPGQVDHVEVQRKTFQGKGPVSDL